MRSGLNLTLNWLHFALLNKNLFCVHYKLTAEQEKELYDVITKKLPKDVGFEPFCNWTAPLACRYVKTVFNVEFSERGMRDVFYRLNLSYTRPTYVLAKADAQKQAEFTEKLEKIKKNSE